MNWDALGAISTAVSALVILLTVIYAARQVGVLNEQAHLQTAQLDHLRRATQLDGTMKVFDQLMATEFVTAYAFVMTRFEERMTDERFRAEALARAPDLETHQELYVMRQMERLGTLIRNGLLDADVILDFSKGVVASSWEKLGPLAFEQRQHRNVASLWENFEYLAAEAGRLKREPPVRARDQPPGTTP